MQTAIDLAESRSEFCKYSYSHLEIDKPKKMGLYSDDKNHHKQYQKIMDFPLDNKKAVIQFSARLAMDNVWSFDYTTQVIKEYKRFLFLMMAADHKVSPSDQIDQAWHLHMMYSNDYWEEFCGNTVNKKLHHWPDEGGGEYRDWYKMTINSYIRFFGRHPPENIWTAPEKRFKTRTWFIRVDREKNWIVPKPKGMSYIKKIIQNLGL